MSPATLLTLTRVGTSRVRFPIWCKPRLSAFSGVSQAVNHLWWDTGQYGGLFTFDIVAVVMNTR